MLHMRPRLAAPMLVGVGAAFHFHAGLVAQAPGWMQRSGLGGSTASHASHGACGDAMPATTLASSPASCAST